MREITAIPTEYRGTTFRSALEARWARYFDAVGWAWKYEPRRFGAWLPDFHLTDFAMWVEIKPNDYQLAAAEALRRCRDAVVKHRVRVVIDWSGREDKERCSLLLSFLTKPAIVTLGACRCGAAPFKCERGCRRGLGQD